jgi:hypothetical protein
MEIAKHEHPFDVKGKIERVFAPRPRGRYHEYIRSKETARISGHYLQPVFLAHNPRSTP